MPTRAETRARRRALVQESLFLASPEGGECSYRAIVARLGYRDAASYDKALRRAGRDDVLYRVKRDPARLAEWLAARDAARRERRLRQLREYNETPERRAANAARMRRVRAEAQRARAAAARGVAWEQVRLAPTPELVAALIAAADPEAAAAARDAARREQQRAWSRKHDLANLGRRRAANAARMRRVRAEAAERRAG